MIPNFLYFILRYIIVILKYIIIILRYIFIFSVENQVEFKGKEAYEIIRFHT